MMNAPALDALLRVLRVHPHVTLAERRATV